MKRRLITAALGMAALATQLAYSQTLSAGEASQLVFMREEEKLARDVYQHLSNKWKLRIFANITRSEQRHFESVGAALVRYGVADPAANAAPGVFVNETLQARYNELVAKGGLAVKDALEVGLAIEKADIADLEKALKDTPQTDLKLLYSNLLAASLNHLEAFENTLEVAGRR